MGESVNKDKKTTCLVVIL